ncbi:MAG: CAP domain-containing protein [Acidimicrobiales bacterium]
MTTTRRIGALLGIVAALVAAMLMIADGVEARAGASVGAIDTFNRSEVASSYRTHIAANQTINHGWSGSVEGCRAGSASSDYDGATLETINWFRRMSGLPAVVENSSSGAAQQAALMMHAEYNLSHYPSADWACHRASGADAAGLSNLTLGIAGSRGVLGQIEDPGAGNAALGHRRWLLYPRLASVGIGNTSRASAITVIGDFAARPAGEWVAWPPAGFVPADTVYDRWSISRNDGAQADFRAASVSMTQNGRAVTVRMLPVQNGFGDNTLAWEPIGIDPNAASDVLYTVTVAGIVVDGRTVSRSYEVVAFDPNSTPSVTPRSGSTTTGVGAECKGRAATIVGTNGDDVLHGTSGPDVIVALAGDDVIRGLDGDDIICAGEGNDEVYGDAGADTILGGAGNDTIRGGAGGDALHGQGGRDRLAGNQGNDLLVGGNRADVLLGNTGRDTCWGLNAKSASPSPDDRRTCEAGRR